MSSEVFLGPLNYIATKIQANPRGWRRGAMWLFLGSFLFFALTLVLAMTTSSPNGKNNPGLGLMMFASQGYIVTGFFLMIGVVFFRFLYQVPVEKQQDSFFLAAERFKLMYRLLAFIAIFILAPGALSTLFFLWGLLSLLFWK